MTQYRVKTPAFVPGFLNAMDALLKDDFQAHFQNTYPAVNILENTTHFDVIVNAPGLSKDEFKISVENDLMTIGYDHKEVPSEVEPKFIKKEFSVKSFKRSFTLNENLNVDEISAKYENGLLTVSIPKKEVKETSTKNIVIN
jgi:HSP20 family protein